MSAATTGQREHMSGTVDVPVWERSGPGPLRLAYADPPYPGQADEHYRDHPDYGGEVDHAQLVERLMDEYPDGWALSTSAQALAEVLAHCPRVAPGVKGRRYRAGTGVRVLSWCKPTAPPMPYCGIYGWEPVIVRQGRAPAAALRDYLVCSPELYTFRTKPADHVTGAKPPAFCTWVFRWLGAEPGDTLVDLFPGSGAVARAWAQYAAQGTLAIADQYSSLAPNGAPTLEALTASAPTGSVPRKDRGAGDEHGKRKQP